MDASGHWKQLSGAAAVTGHAQPAWVLEKTRRCKFQSRVYTSELPWVRGVKRGIVLLF